MIEAARRWCLASLAALSLCGATLGTTSAQAHLMAAQKGTLNLVGDAAFLVLAVPVSALRDVDDNRDGLLSVDELRAHNETIRHQVQAGVQLRGPAGLMPLQLVMLDVAPPDNAPKAAASHLTVMGRFQLSPAAVPTDAKGQAAPEALSLSFSLFGKAASERQQDLTITRQKETQWLRYLPERSTQALLPPATAVLAEYVRSGATHVLTGLDHLLFLLVVLAAGWGWRSLLGALTCFTAGHGLTLIVCVWGGWFAPAAIVEPALAATSVGMAAFDFWGRWRALPMRPGLRLGLVFCCALIHGLGLAGGLADLGVNSSNLGWSLAGFNTGIELAQVGVAALFAAAMQGLRLALGPRGPVMAARLASVIGAVVGLCWFAERLVPPPDINSKVVAAADAKAYSKAYSKAYCQQAPNLSCAGQTVGWGAMPP